VDGEGVTRVRVWCGVVWQPLVEDQGSGANGVRLFSNVRCLEGDRGDVAAQHLTLDGGPQDGQENLLDGGEVCSTNHDLGDIGEVYSGNNAAAICWAAFSSSCLTDDMCSDAAATASMLENWPN
jgi:hypothetical protein